MSNSYTNSNSTTYTEARAKYVMGKIFDDFHAIGYRGFEFFKENPGKLTDWKEDLDFILSHNALRKFQLQFHAPGGRAWAIEYVVHTDSSIQRDSDSGGVDFWEIPIDANINILVDRDPDNQEVSDYLAERGWGTGGFFIGGPVSDGGAYSQEGFGVTKGRRGTWNQ